MTAVMKNIALIVYLLVGMLPRSIFAQDVDSVESKPVYLRIKPQGLYDIPEPSSTSFHGFSQLTVFEKNLSDMVWWTTNSTCINVTYENDSTEQAYLKLVWNKDQTGCDWVGMGFGWDSWSAKDMGYLKDSLAFAITIRSKNRTVTNVPWAFGIEDYSGNQAWLGFKKEHLDAGTIASTWTTILIPVQDFPILDNGLDLTSTKQFIIQFFATGSFDLQSIHLVPYRRTTY